jgi:uncharacterized damage-inducible protein DinB
MDKTELLEVLEDSRQELLELLEALPDEMMLEPVRPDGWAIKDLLAHLTYWEGQTVTLLFQAQRGAAKPSTAHFGKETVEQLNARWHASSRERPLEMIWQDWISVRKQLLRRTNELSEADLTSPGRFPWLKNKALYELILSDTVEHEEEHADQIRAWLDQIDTPPPSSDGSNGKIK